MSSTARRLTACMLILLLLITGSGYGAAAFSADPDRAGVGALDDHLSANPDGEGCHACPGHMSVHMLALRQADAVVAVPPRASQVLPGVNRFFPPQRPSSLFRPPRALA